MNNPCLVIRYVSMISVAIFSITPVMADSITDGLTVTGGAVTINVAGAGTLNVATTDNRANCFAQIQNNLAVWSGNSTTESDILACDTNYYNNGSSPTWLATRVTWFPSGVSGNYPNTSIPYAYSSLIGGNNCANLVFGENTSNPISFVNSSGLASTIQPDTSTSFFGVIPTSGSPPASGEVRIGGGDIEMGGILYATEIKVNSNGWPDYVFDKGYRLKSLDEVEEYIAQEKHLPDIASATEIKSCGIPVSEMVTKQLEKIEELTLYVIAIDKENKRIREENEALKAQYGKSLDEINHRLQLLEKP